MVSGGRVVQRVLRFVWSWRAAGATVLRKDKEVRSKGQRSAGQEPGSLARSPRPGPSPPKHDLGHGTKSAETTGVSPATDDTEPLVRVSVSLSVALSVSSSCATLVGPRGGREPCHKRTHTHTRGPSINSTPCLQTPHSYFLSLPRQRRRDCFKMLADSWKLAHFKN